MTTGPPEGVPEKFYGGINDRILKLTIRLLIL